MFESAVWQIQLSEVRRQIVLDMRWAYTLVNAADNIPKSLLVIINVAAMHFVVCNVWNTAVLYKDGSKMQNCRSIQIDYS